MTITKIMCLLIYLLNKISKIKVFFIVLKTNIVLNLLTQTNKLLKTLFK